MLSPEPINAHSPQPRKEYSLREGGVFVHAEKSSTTGRRILHRKKKRAPMLHSRGELGGSGLMTGLAPARVPPPPPLMLVRPFPDEEAWLWLRWMR